MNYDQKYTENSIRTYTGKVFDLKILDPDSICIEDIAHALSNTARFAGHLPRMYSVAQHSVWVAARVPAEHRLAALLHDASEAYIGDMPSPFKKMMPEYKEIEERLMQAIFKKFGLEYPLHPCIKEMDMQALDMEWDSYVMNSEPFPASILYPFQAKAVFLQIYEETLRGGLIHKSKMN